MEESRAAKIAKLDPDNYKSAKDVLDEQQSAICKRKREEGDADVRDERLGSVSLAKSSDATDTTPAKRAKKQERGEKHSLNRSIEPAENSNRRTKMPKPEKQLTLDHHRKGQGKPNAENNQSHVDAKEEGRNEDLTPYQDASKYGYVYDQSQEYSRPQQSEQSQSSGNVNSNITDIPSSPASPLSPSRSSGFDGSTHHSGSSSLTSIDLHPSSDHPSTREATKEFARHGQSNPENDPAQLKIRLQARIETLRAARKADGPNGAPARNRQDLLDARRQKEEMRKAHKKEQRRKLKEEEALKKAETLAKGSPLLSPGSPASAFTDTNSNLSFGRVDFGNGQRTSADLGTINQPKKGSKGPSDPATALVGAQNKEARLAGLDSEKRKDITEKDSWLKAQKRAQGECMRDDTNLLKRTLKRKQSQKKKSERDWRERLESVKKREDRRQKKREANLSKRREARGKKSKARAGFEGSFRTKTSSNK